MGHLIEGHPERVAEIAQAHRPTWRAYTAHYPESMPARGGDAYVIPVVFHIIHNNGPENISDAQVRDAIRVMNQDYHKQTPDWADVQPEFLDIVANVGITFEARAVSTPTATAPTASRAPQSILTYQGDQAMKRPDRLAPQPLPQHLGRRGPRRRCGLLPCTPPPFPGPGARVRTASPCWRTYVGSIGTSSLTNSHTLSHEAGHWMNLKHCWGDTNNPGLTSKTAIIDDGVADTPDTKGLDQLQPHRGLLRL
jgi:hypothetical protein